jgi:hypothetical protein
MSTGLIGLTALVAWSALTAWRGHRAGWFGEPTLLLPDDLAVMRQHYARPTTVKAPKAVPEAVEAIGEHARIAADAVTALTKAAEAVDPWVDTCPHTSRPKANPHLLIETTGWVVREAELLWYRAGRGRRPEARATATGWVTWRENGTVIGEGRATSLTDAFNKANASFEAYADLSAKAAAIIAAHKEGPQWTGGDVVRLRMDPNNPSQKIGRATQYSWGAWHPDGRIAGHGHASSMNDAIRKADACIAQHTA